MEETQDYLCPNKDGGTVAHVAPGELCGKWRGQTWVDPAGEVAERRVPAAESRSGAPAVTAGQGAGTLPLQLLQEVSRSGDQNRLISHSTPHFFTSPLWNAVHNVTSRVTVAVHSVFIFYRLYGSEIKNFSMYTTSSLNVNRPWLRELIWSHLINHPLSFLVSKGCCNDQVFTEISQVFKGSQGTGCYSDTFDQRWKLCNSSALQPS